MRRVVLAAVGALLVACGGGADDAGGPIVDRFPDAVAAVEAHYGGPQEYFELTAGVDRIVYVVAVDDGTAGETGEWSPDGGFVEPEPVGAASGATFRAEQLDLDPDRIFEQIADELGDAAIIDLAVQGGPDDTVIYDATIASEFGGVILVLLGPNGEIRGVQGT